MTWDGLDTSDTHHSFDIPRWHEDGALWLDYCDEYWRHLRRELEVVRLGPLEDHPGGDEVPYHEIENRYGRRLPAAARAAAGLRRSLALAIQQLVPEAGVVAPAGEDEVERAMAVSSGGDDAVRIALGDIDRMKGLLASARPGRGLTVSADITEVVLFLREELERQVRSFEALARPRPARLSTQPLGKTGHTRVPADRINKAVIEALAPGAMKELPAGFFDIFGPGVRFWRAYAFGAGRRSPGYDQLVGVVGLREEPDESLWRLLPRGGALAVKIHLALWERAYAEAGGTYVKTNVKTYVKKGAPAPSDYVNTTLTRLCDDIGLQRKKGAHKRESRETVAGLLELLTSLELHCLYKPPRNVPPEVIRGAVWRRGIVPAEVGPYRDLFASKAGRAAAAAPQSFSYAPGYYFSHPTWRGHNKYVALVPAGLLGMSCASDHRWAVLAGAYLSLLGRINRYKKRALSMRTVAERIGLRAIYGEKHMEDAEVHLGATFAKLRKAGVVKDIRWIEPREAGAPPGGGDAEGSARAKGDRPPGTRKRKGNKDPKFEVTWPEDASERGRLLRERHRKKLVQESARKKKDTA